MNILSAIQANKTKRIRLVEPDPIWYEIGQLTSVVGLDGHVVRGQWEVEGEPFTDDSKEIKEVLIEARKEFLNEIFCIS